MSERYYSYIDPTVGIGSEILAGQDANGGQYGVRNSVDIVARDITATGNFIGEFTSPGSTFINLNVTGIATIGGNLSVGGTITYEDVTNVDSIGIITARSGIVATGVVTATSFDGTVTNATNLNNQAASYYLNYNNFTNTPTIPTNNNQLTNGAGYITDITTQTDPKYLRSDTSDTFSGGTLTVNGGSGLALKAESDDFAEQLEIHRNHATNSPAIKFSNDAKQVGILYASASDDELVWRNGSTTNNRKIWNEGNDGSGSGLDADTVDGIQGASFLRSDTTDDFSGILQGNNAGGTYFNLRGGGNGNTLLFRVSAAETDENISSNLSSDYGFNIRYRGDLGGVENAFQIDADNQAGSSIEALRIKQNGVTYFGPTPLVGSSTIWHAGNDGAGSGLDADTLDGYQFATELGPSAVGNFGQWQAHSSYSSGFNANISYWGWNYVQSNTNAPNSTSSQWYRNRVSLGDQYGFGYSSGDYWLEMTYPRYNNTSAGHMWVRTCENGTVGSWTQVGANIIGNFTATGNVTAYSSDRRLKTNFKPITNALDKVSTLNGLYFDWKEEVNELGFNPDQMTNDFGLIAQEVQDILPQAVKPAPFDQVWDEETKKNISSSGEDYITIQYERIVPLLVEAIKELKEEVETLKKERN